MSTRAPLLCLLFLGSLGHAQEEPRWELFQLGGFEGTNSNAQGINDLGDIAGRADGRASVWSNGQLITLPNPNSTALSSDAWDANHFGLVAGCSYDLATGRQQATLWTTTASLVVGALPGGTESCAHALNNLHLHVGASTTVGSAVQHAFVGYLGELIDLHRLVPWAGLESVAWDINDKGQVVGTVTDQNSNDRAVLWDVGGRVVDLGTLGGAEGSARGINEAGDVVGSAETADGVTHAFLNLAQPPSRRAQQMYDLGAPPSAVLSEGIDLNEAREVVGWAQYQTPNGAVFVATYWSADAGMIDLQARVAHPDWHLEQANGINANGDIVGYGWHYPVRDRRGFLLRRMSP